MTRDTVGLALLIAAALCPAAALADDSKQPERPGAATDADRGQPRQPEGANAETEGGGEAEQKRDSAQQQKRVGNAQQDAAAAGDGRLTVWSEPSGAPVRIDGEAVGSTPLTRPVAGGSHTIEIGTGARRVVRGVDMEPGGTAAVAVRLSEKPRRQRRHRRRPRLWTWIAAGTGVIAGAAAIGVWASAKADHGEFELTPDPLRYDELKDRIETEQLATNILFGISGALIVTAAVLFFLEDPGEAGSERAPKGGSAAALLRSLSVAAGRGLSLGGRF